MAEKEILKNAIKTMKNLLGKYAKLTLIDGRMIKGEIILIDGAGNVLLKNAKQYKNSSLLNLAKFLKFSKLMLFLNLH